MLAGYATVPLTRPTVRRHNAPKGALTDIGLPSMSLPCFKAYDIRGRVPDELNEAIAYRLGLAYAAQLKAKLEEQGAVVEVK